MSGYPLYTLGFRAVNHPTSKRFIFYFFRNLTWVCFLVGDKAGRLFTGAPPPPRNANFLTEYFAEGKRGLKSEGFPREGDKRGMKTPP